MGVTNMAGAPGYGESIGLIRPRVGWVPKQGFQWLEGQYGLRGSRSFFLVGNSPEGQVKQVPDDVYVEFWEVECSPASTLAFANRFGELGIPRTHFHYGQKSGLAEISGEWSLEIAEFKTCFEAFNLVQDGKAAAVERFLKKRLGPGTVPPEDPLFSHTERWREWSPKDPFAWAMRYIVGSLNHRLRAGKDIRAGRCFMKGCHGGKIWPNASTVDISPHVSVSYNLVEGQKGGGAAQLSLNPATLLTTIWLQFGEFIAGARTIRRCEVCGMWMDISEAARKGAKRMHERCSLNRRMQKYRKSREEERGA